MSVICTTREFTSRANQIPKLLSPLIPYGKRIASSRATSSRDSVIYGAYSGNSPINEKYTDWRFKTKSSEIFGCYYEIWSIYGNNSYILNHAYLQILDSEQEILALHCDPSESASSKFYKYKAGPHLHIKHPTNDKVSKAHIALHLENFQYVISSLKSLENSFIKAIQMINDEFF